MKKQIKQGPAVDLTSETQKLLDRAVTIGSATVVIGELPHVSAEKLRSQIDWLRKKAPGLIAVLGTRDTSKVQLLAAVDDAWIEKGISAGAIIKTIAKTVGGGGGGRDQMAQAGGKFPDKLPQALSQAETIIREKLENNP